MNKYDYITPIPQKATIASLVRFVLENNFFTFNKKYYKQKIGASMGSKCSPEITDIRTFEVIREIITMFETKDKIIFLGRYRDDGLITYSGSEEELLNLFSIANSFHPLSVVY